jgi:plastocyanin
MKMLRIGATLGAMLLGMTAAPGQAAPAPAHVVTIANMSYGRVPTDLKVGDTLTWVNHDSVPHTVTARDHSFDVRINPGETVKMTMQKAGDTPFYCSLHPTMRGTLKVAAK